MYNDYMKKFFTIFIVISAILIGSFYALNSYIYNEKQADETTETQEVKLYFYNPSLDQGVGGAQCTNKGLVEVVRTIPKTETPLQDSIRLLLEGRITDEEKASGVTTEFPLTGLSLKSANIKDGVATLEFIDPKNSTVGGSCRVAILWAQISTTAKQFSSVNEVRFTPEELFQP